MILKNLLKLMAIVSWTSAIARGPGDFPCLRVFNEIERQQSLASIQDVKNRFKQLPEKVRRRYEEVEAQRLINAKDWQEAKQALKEDADLFYSERSLTAWKNARAFTQQHVQDPLTPALLKSIHSVSMKDLPFHGYEGRRLRLKFEKGEIDKATFKDKLHSVYTEDANPSGTDHKNLAGQFRADPIDNIRHGGSNVSPDIGRYFDAAELQAARKNPYMIVDEKSVKKIAPGQFEANSYFSPPEKVQSEVDKIFQRLNLDLARAGNEDDVIHAVAAMEKDLIVVHPFLDGNGRTIRLFGDLILERHGLPPPILLREEEITSSVEDFAFDIKHGMRIYLEQKELGAKGETK